MKRIIAFLFIAAHLGAFAQTDILDARTNFSITDEVTVTGIVTNGDEFGTIRYIEDGTAGIGIYPGGSDWGSFDTPAVGDEITVTGILSEYNGLLEVGPDLSSVTIVSSENTLPAPQVMSPNEMGENDEGELIQIQNCFFSDAGSQFGSNSTHTFTSNGQEAVIYVRSSSPLVGMDIPFGDLTLTGIASQFSFTGDDGYQLLCRTIDDIVQTSPLNLTTPVSQENVTTTSFVLTWTTDSPGNTMVEWGISPDDLSNSDEIDESVTDHSFELTSLEPATIYYCRVATTDGEFTAQSTIVPFITRSNSSGEITVYFTKSVDTDFATEEDAVGLFTLTNDTLAAYINRATSTLDIAMYNINDQTLVNAINDAYESGVTIRYVAHGGNANTGIQSFNDGIPVIYRTDDLGSGMHNKFLIIDADIEEKATLITGSTNFTTENLIDDYNNIIIFQEQSLARGYRVEFEEMWGSSGNEPDEDAAVFGSDKTNNTPKLYYSGDTEVEVYFSPTDNTTAALIEAIGTANYECDFSVLTFTRDDVADAVITVQEGFSSFSRGVIEQVSNQGSEYDYLLQNGVQVESHEQVSGQLHHKYAILDPNNTDSDPMVVTGSHNWSSSAENFNDENTVFVHDARVANLYFQEFMARWGEIVSAQEYHDEPQLLVYPNPAPEFVFIQLDTDHNWNVALYDMNGRLVEYRSNLRGLVKVDVNHLPNGLYTLNAQSNEMSYSSQLVVE